MNAGLALAVAAPILTACVLRFAQLTGRQMVLVVRGPNNPLGLTVLSGSLKLQVMMGKIKVRYI